MLRRLLSVTAISTLALAMPAATLQAQGVSIPQAGDDEDDYESGIVVTGARIRQGGAQDIANFRSLSFDENSLPFASSLTVEGLLGEHDLALPGNENCAQLFCVNVHTMAANLPMQPEAALFLGIGFDSGANASTYLDEPVSIIATVDRSGSMSGPSIAKAKEALHEIVTQLRPGDRMGIVIYGSDTLIHLPVVDVAGNETQIHEAIDAIEINGSTYMEAGLKLGFAAAVEELERSNGRTRVMLFTDENPNVGNTSAEGFMGQARTAAEQGIGLTTIGVGRIFRGPLATKVSSVRGGNLFYLGRNDEAKELFEREFRNMINEVAYDLAITIDPAEGFAIGNVYGVPLDIMSRDADGRVTVSIASAFLSSNGGGIFASLEPTGEASQAPAATVSVSYVDALDDSAGRHEQVARRSSRTPPAALSKAHLLVDQYLTMSGAMAQYHRKKDAAGARDMLAGLAERISSSGIDGLEEEAALVDKLYGSASKLASLETDPKYLRTREVVGRWKVLRHNGVRDLARGDIMVFEAGGGLTTEHNSGPRKDEETWQDYAINENRLMIDGTSLRLRYERDGDLLNLFSTDGVTISLIDEDAAP